MIIKPEFNDSLKINIDEYEYYNCIESNSSLHISKKALRIIEELLWHHYPNEFGGVFIGFKSSNNIIISNVLIPDSYKSGKAVFVRHPGTLNQRLSEIHKITNGSIQYLGEWHSHPDGTTNPSLTDLNAMKAIGNDKKINNHEPILMIAKVTSFSFGKDFYKYENNKLMKYG